MRLLRSITLFLTVSAIAAGAASQAGDELWNKANQAYAAGRFEEAKVDYLQLVQHGAPTGNLFYNLGNSWFKLGDNGRAILNYKRALALEPAEIGQPKITGGTTICRFPAHAEQAIASGSLSLIVVAVDGREMGRAGGMVSNSSTDKAIVAMIIACAVPVPVMGEW